MRRGSGHPKVRARRIVQYEEIGGGKRPLAAKRNTLVLGAVLFILATFAWAGWANFEYRQQAAALRTASAERGMLVADPESGPPEYVSPLKGKTAPAFALEDLTG